MNKRPADLTFLGVLSACRHGGFVDGGRQLFWGIKPRVEHHGCMADLFSCAGLLDEAYSLVWNMPMKPNDAVWGSPLLGCRIHNNAELASQVAQKLVADVYATAKRWQDVAAVRQKMIKMGVRKPPGQSSVQINGVLHDFVADDSTYRHASLIYKMLGEITVQAMREGYNPDISELFLGIED